MKLILAALFLPVAASIGTAQDFISSEVLPERLEALRHLDPHSEHVWAEYINLSQTLIEKTRRQNPQLLNEGREPYEKSADLPSTLKDIEGTARELDEAVEKRFAGTSGAIETELRFLIGRFRTARTALQPAIELAAERERKQRVIAEVIVLITGVLAEQTDAQKEQSDWQGGNKADSLLQAINR